MPEIPTVNPSPRSRFLAYKPFVDAHRELIHKPELRRAFDYALEELAWQLCDKEVEGNSAAARHYQLCGAHALIGTFMRLAETPIAVNRQPGEREITHEFK